MLSIYLLTPTFLPGVNKYRMAMYVEGGGDVVKVEQLNSFSDLIYGGSVGALNFMLKPFLWEATNIFQLIQSVENIILFVIIGYLLLKKIIRKNSSSVYTNIWFAFLAFSFSLYGVVVANYGTSARYKFTFIVVFVIFYCYESKMESKYVR